MHKSYVNTQTGLSRILYFALTFLLNAVEEWNFVSRCILHMQKFWDIRKLQSLEMWAAGCLYDFMLFWELWSPRVKNSIEQFLFIWVWERFFLVWLLPQWVGFWFNFEKLKKKFFWEWKNVGNSPRINFWGITNFFIECIWVPRSLGLRKRFRGPNLGLFQGSGRQT